MVSLRYWDKKKLEEAMSPAYCVPNKYKVPVFIGEFSAARWAPGANDYLKDLMDIFDSHRLGWTYFQYKSYHDGDPGIMTLHMQRMPRMTGKSIMREGYTALEASSRLLFQRTWSVFPAQDSGLEK